MLSSAKKTSGNVHPLLAFVDSVVHRFQPLSIISDPKKKRGLPFAEVTASLRPRVQFVEFVLLSLPPHMVFFSVVAAPR